MSSKICSYAKLCSGCSEWNTPYSSQLNSKQNDLLNGLNQSSIPLDSKPIVHFVGPQSVRDRLDFTIEGERIGLYSSSSKQIVDLESCLQLSEELQAFYNEFRKINWPIKRGSIRLRVSPTGKRGAWLDFSNLDVKFLLEEQSTLRELSKLCVIEIGQRRKTLQVSEELTLQPPVLRPWMNSIFMQQEVSIYSTVGSFTQVGHEANKLLVKIIQLLCSKINKSNLTILEYGAGCGNLTFPAMNLQTQVFILENDQLGILGHKKTAQELNLQNQIHYLKSPKEVNLSLVDLILANPPRSGLSDLLQKMYAIEISFLPKNFIYMSCFQESFFRDAQMLSQMGYKITELHIVDQFPQTKHYETIAFMSR